MFEKSIKPFLWELPNVFFWSADVCMCVTVKTPVFFCFVLIFVFHVVTHEAECLEELSKGRT